MPNVTTDQRPLDERLFFSVILLAAVVIATVTTVSILHSRRTETMAEARTLMESVTPERHLIDFTLTDRTGRTVRRAELEGKFLVVNFVFASCSLSCLQVNYRMAEIQRLTADQPDVRLVSVTVDPQSDTPSALAKFAERFGADTNRWLFLTGEKQAVFPLIEQSFLGPPDPKLAGLLPGGFVNIDRIAVVDMRGRLRAVSSGIKASISSEVLELIKMLRTQNLKP